MLSNRRVRCRKNRIYQIENRPATPAGRRKESEHQTGSSNMFKQNWIFNEILPPLSQFSPMDHVTQGPGADETVKYDVVIGLKSWPVSGISFGG